MTSIGKILDLSLRLGERKTAERENSLEARDVFRRRTWGDFVTRCLMRRYNPRKGQEFMAKGHQSRIPGAERARLG
jgi:hypothetical protein